MTGIAARSEVSTQAEEVGPEEEDGPGGTEGVRLEPGGGPSSEALGNFGCLNCSHGKQFQESGEIFEVFRTHR